MNKLANKSRIPVFIVFVLLFYTSCSVKKGIKKEPDRDRFYETARFIMTKEEKRIYKKLPDQEAREEFITQFWKVRDPDPYTDDNEYRIEFEERIRYANEWFVENKGAPDKGWSTDRGRILLLLGHPDVLAFWDGTNRIETLTNRRIKHKTWYTEEWYYERYRLYLVFRMNGFRRLVLLNWSRDLLTAIELAKAEINNQGKHAFKTRFTFKAKFKESNIILTIPVQRLSFEELEGRMQVGFQLDIFIYLNGKIIDTLKKSEILKEDPNDLLTKKNISMVIPFKPTKKGKYLLDIIIKEMSTKTKYRSQCKFRY
jgi:GWxTD domain-containing protein